MSSSRARTKLRRMPKASSKTHALVVLLLGALVLLGFFPALMLPFLSDDYAIIRLVTLPDGASTNWGAVLADFWTPLLTAGSFYRPMYSISYGLGFELWGTWPLPYHLVNLALHLFVSFCVYLVALELVPGERRVGAAVTAGALFALHPFHPEVVTWVAGRVDSICAAFYLPALLFFLRWLRTEKGLDYALSLAFFVLALSSKEMAVMLPALVSLVALYRRGRLLPSALAAAPFWAVLGLYLVFRTYVLTSVDAHAAVERRFRPFESLEALVHRTLHAFAPLNLGLLPEGWEGAATAGVFLLAVPLALVLAFALLRRRVEGRFVALASALYLVSLAPVFKILDPEPLLTGSRYLYLPLAFLAILVAYFLWSVGGGRLPYVATVLACTALLSVLLLNQGPWLRAGEIAGRHLRANEDPGLNLKYEGAHVFGSRITWIAANNPPFEPRTRREASSR